MGKRLTRQEKVDQLIIELINEMFKFAELDVTYDDIKDRKDSWFSEYTMTQKQNNEWFEFGRKLISKKLKMNKDRAIKEMTWINLMWGLKISDWKTGNVLI